MKRETILQPPRSDALKLLGVVAMTIDHIGFVFASVLPLGLMALMRGIGRLAFPVFAYYAAVGAVHTKNKAQYFLRLAVGAALSQPAFFWMAHGINVLVTLMAGVLSIWLAQVLAPRIGAFSLLSPVIPGLICQLAGTDYGIYGVFTVFAWYFFDGSRQRQAGAQTVLTVAVLCVPPLNIGTIQLLSLLSLPIIFSFVRVQETKIHLPRFFFYAFYPVHMTVLWWIYEGFCK